ncbi:hypothetical protein [Ruegeria atlantica]|uniref:hypothetical protein n=1 Tax=Ruegeria atlantica TaxID=81569 RepID=UPI00249567F1|nr:hypothetical protein [Ruegeria atlantica]
MEDQTSHVLFRRLHVRGMELTAQGIEFLRYAEQMLNYVDHMEIAVADIAQHRARTLRVGAFIRLLHSIWRVLSAAVLKKARRSPRY